MDTQLYFESLTLELNALKDRVRNFIDDQHWLTDGEWKESVLRSILRRHLPKSATVGKGFVITPERPSTQIDILIYDTNSPILYQDGDLVFVSPDAVLGVIEVKTTARPNSLEQSLSKLADNVELIRNGSFRENRFFGFFAYDSVIQNAHEPLQALKNVACGNRRTINCVSLGASYFVRYWYLPPTGPRRPIDKWFAYDLHNKAPAYFIYNVVEHICPNSVFENNNLWFPENGKEPHKIDEITRREVEQPQTQ